MECLHAIVVGPTQNNPAPSDPDAMQVDSIPPSISDAPTLPLFLVLCVTYTTSPAALRSAIRRSFNNAEDALYVLRVIEQWVNRWSTLEFNLLPANKEVSRNEHGVVVLKKKEKAAKKDLPPLNDVSLLSPAALIIWFLA